MEQSTRGVDADLPSDESQNAIASSGSKTSIQARNTQGYNKNGLPTWSYNANDGEKGSNPLINEEACASVPQSEKLKEATMPNSSNDNVQAQSTQGYDKTGTPTPPCTVKDEVESSTQQMNNK